jgi:hypothetical protein
VRAASSKADNLAHGVDPILLIRQLPALCKKSIYIERESSPVHNRELAILF